MMRFASRMNAMPASAPCAEASSSCARFAPAHTVSLQLMDAIMTASIIICAICAIFITASLVLRLALVLVLLVCVLLNVLLLAGETRTPKSWGSSDLL